MTDFIVLVLAEFYFASRKHARPYIFFILFLEALVGVIGKVTAEKRKSALDFAHFLVKLICVLYVMF